MTKRTKRHWKFLALSLIFSGILFCSVSEDTFKNPDKTDIGDINGGVIPTNDNDNNNDDGDKVTTPIELTQEELQTEFLQLLGGDFKYKTPQNQNSKGRPDFLIFTDGGRTETYLNQQGKLDFVLKITNAAIYKVAYTNNNNIISTNEIGIVISNQRIFIAPLLQKFDGSKEDIEAYNAHYNRTNMNWDGIDYNNYQFISTEL